MLGEQFAGEGGYVVDAQMMRDKEEAWEEQWQGMHAPITATAAYGGRLPQLQPQYQGYRPGWYAQPLAYADPTAADANRQEPARSRQRKVATRGRQLPQRRPHLGSTMSPYGAPVRGAAAYGRTRPVSARVRRAQPTVA